MLARLARLVLPLSFVLGACTDGSVTPEHLPATELPPEATLEYHLRPAEPAAVKPPSNDPQLVAGHPSHDRFAISDGRRLWLGAGEELRELERSYATATKIEAMQMDAEGALWLLQADNSLHRVDEEGMHALPELPVRATSLHAGAGRLVLLGTLADTHELPADEPLREAEYVELDSAAVLAVSVDGREWSLRRRPADWSEEDDLAIGPEGDMTLMDGNEASCGGGWQERWQGHLERGGWTSLAWPHDDPSHRVAAAKGWTYGYETCDDGSSDVLCAVNRTGLGVPLLPARYDSYALAHVEGQTMVVTPEGLYSVRKRWAERIAAGHPALSKSYGVPLTISAERALFVDAGQVHIGSAEGWSARALPL